MQLSTFLFLILAFATLTFCFGLYFGERTLKGSFSVQRKSRNRVIMFYVFVGILSLLVFFVLFKLRKIEPTLPLSEVLKLGSVGIVAISLVFTMVGYHFTISKHEQEIEVKRNSTTLDLIKDWYKDPLAQYSMKIKSFEKTNAYKFLKSDNAKFLVYFNKDDDLHKAIVGILNYFEVVASSHDQNLLNSIFLQRFFKPLMDLYYDDWIVFIREKRVKDNFPDLWEDFTNLVESWRNEGQEFENT